jgi:hypothetical protein
MTSPVIVASRCCVPVPKWIVGAAIALRILWEYGETNST